MLSENVEKFITTFAKSLENQTFVKMTLGNYRGAKIDGAEPQKVLIRLVEIKKGTRLFVLYRYETRDTAKNYDFAEGVKIVRKLLGNGFLSGHLFTTENDFQLDVGKKDKSRLNVGKPTFKTKPDAIHNREKQNLIAPNSSYLQALGVANERGEVLAKQQDKYKQINKFVETLGKLFDESNLKDKREFNIVDMGSGKGYLTFAAYDYFNNLREINAKIIGIDTRKELIDLCNDIAKTCDFNGLRFEKSFIRDFELESVDVLIALHACNTATDEAIFKGISANASLIICAPCCHQELRPQIKAPQMFKDILKHGIMLEREAETLTDGIRALLLEKNGYKTKLFEFIATEHTPKNNLIVGIKSDGKSNDEIVSRQIQDIKEFYGIREQRLETLLSEARS